MVAAADELEVIMCVCLDIVDVVVVEVSVMVDEETMKITLAPSQTDNRWLKSK